MTTPPTLPGVMIRRGLQARNATMGDMRTGHKVPTNTPGKTRPAGLTKFRFTSHNLKALGDIADRHGGRPEPWRRNEYQLYTEAGEIPVALPPGSLVIRSSMQMWTTKGGLIRMCDGERMFGGSACQQFGQACMCPQAQDPDDPAEAEWAADRRKRMSRMNPPQACKPSTVLHVILPDVGGDVGTWRLTSHSEQAASEIIAKAMLLHEYRALGHVLPATVAIEQHESFVDGQTSHYVTPVLRIDMTFRDLATGALTTGEGDINAQLGPAPAGRERAALTTGPAPAPAVIPPERRVIGGELALTPQMLCEAAARATTSQEVAALVPTMRDNQWEQEEVWPPAGAPDEAEVKRRLDPYLHDRFDTLKAAEEREPWSSFGG